MSRHHDRDPSYLRYPEGMAQDNESHTSLDEDGEALLREAIELAHGRRHLTVVHGDPCEVSTSRQLSEFYEELRRLAAGCEWVRIRGNAEYVTVTIGGAIADERIALFEAAAAFVDPGDWTIVATAVPPPS